jgi:hypothetical protein
LAERLLCKERVRSSSLLVSTTRPRECCNRRSRDHPSRHRHQPVRTRAADRAPDPCPAPPAGHRPADRWATVDVRIDLSGGPFFGPHLNNWIVFGRNEESSISPSSQGNDPDRSRPRLTAWSDAGGGQATKGTGWMPWRQEPMKDVEGCEKLRGVANRL